MKKRPILRRVIAGLIDWNVIFLVGILLLTAGPAFDFR